MKRRDRPGKFTLLFILLGLLVTGVELFSSLKGWRICPFQGCTLALASSYSSLLGIPLTAWGFGFFFVALLLWLLPKKWMLFWSALGLGAALYFVYIQRWVLGTVCPMCLVVEFLVFLLFLSVLTRVSLWCLFSLVVISFLGLHTLYTWTSLQRETCLGKEEMDLLQKYYTAGKGPKEAVFFFSLECPACARVLPEVKEWALREGVRVAFREVRIHREEKKAFYLLSLLKGGMDPWDALGRVEGSKRVPGVRLGKREKRVVLRLLDFNGRLLESLGIDGVPVLLVMEGDKLEGRRGREGIEELLGSPGGRIPGRTPSLELKGQAAGGEGTLSPEGPKGGICTPQGCD